MSPLFFVILIPVLTGLFCFLAPGAAKKTALLGAVLNAILLGGIFFSYDLAATGTHQFIMQWAVVPAWGLNFTLGADGFSLVMLLLAGLVTLAAIWISPTPDKMPGLYYGNVMLISAGVIGAFASIDVFFFYAFHELALIPTFLLIGIWGSGDRQAAAWKATIYLALGSFVLLLGLIGLYLSVPPELRTFDMRLLAEMGKQGILRPDTWVYLLLLFGFGTLVSLFPFHTWAPAAYACAPAPAAMLHAGVLKKFGLYGLFRLVSPIFPETMQAWSPLLLGLIICNILYVGYVTTAQKRLDWMIGYSSVMHMGYIFLGFAGGLMNQLSSTGAGLLMFAHGLSVAALLGLAGQLRQRTGTLEFSELGGLGRITPAAGLLFGFATMASLGLPGFANFAGEILIFFGAFASGGEQPFNLFQITTVVAVWGVVISALYGLRAYRAIYFGESPERWKGLPDLDLQSRLALVLLLLALMVVGFYPQLLVTYLTPALIAQ
jgi:NADH-quinone oxidoreductase subunit M